MGLALLVCFHIATLPGLAEFSFHFDLLVALFNSGGRHGGSAISTPALRNESCVSSHKSGEWNGSGLRSSGGWSIRSDAALLGVAERIAADQDAIWSYRAIVPSVRADGDVEGGARGKHGDDAELWKRLKERNKEMTFE
jgi:hypothetical protein